MASDDARGRATTDSVMVAIRERRTEAAQGWDLARTEASKDRLCVAGKVWEAMDPKGLSRREDAMRPHLALDELGQYLNQSVNDIRANPRGIRYAPADGEANEAGAEFYMNHTREIEYRSHAPVAYSTAFQHMVEHSYGWVRVVLKRAHLRTFNQDIWIVPVPNADLVLSDPMAVWPDSRDMNYLFYIERWTQRDFKARWPKAKAVNFSAGEIASVAPQWGDKSGIDLAEYWERYEVMRTLLAIELPADAKDPRAPRRIVEVLKDELPGGEIPDRAIVKREEAVPDHKVRMSLTNGIEVLKETEWPGAEIPFASCFGKALYIDGKRHISSMTRLARDPIMLHAYIKSCEAEAIGAVPRAQWVGYKGQFSERERWESANDEPLAYLEAEAMVPGAPAGAVLPLPQRQPWDPPIQNLEIAAEAARRAIQAAMGTSPLPTQAQRRNEKSGVALERIESSGQRGAFHFVDSYELMIERVGAIIQDLITPVIDTARDVAVRLPDGDTGAIVRVNDPNAETPISTKGTYRVTISTGPATDSQRAEASDFVDQLAQTGLQIVASVRGPEAAAKVLAKAVKLKSLGPIGDEIIEILDPKQDEEAGGIPPEQLQAIQQENEQLKALLQRAATEKQAKVIELQGKFAIAQMQEEAESERAAADREVKVAIATLTAQLKRIELFLEERARRDVEAHEDTQAVLDRQHEVNMAARALAAPLGEEGA